mmetsp:Transcript_49839/g.103980  ORF Transcript_49839/g.103980 Transcript_49839/m.103980 type:complete len:204 (+) Transcript_49839:1460-2071(+)
MRPGPARGRRQDPDPAQSAARPEGQSAGEGRRHLRADREHRAHPCVDSGRAGGGAFGERRRAAAAAAELRGQSRGRRGPVLQPGACGPLRLVRPDEKFRRAARGLAVRPPAGERHERALHPGQRHRQAAPPKSARVLSQRHAAGSARPGVAGQSPGPALSVPDPHIPAVLADAVPCEHALHSAPPFPCAAVRGYLQNRQLVRQ